MLTKALLVLAASVAAVAIPATAGAVYSLIDFQSATDALVAVDATIDPPPNDPNRDFVVGGFKTIDNTNFAVSAHSGAMGENRQGHVSETRTQFFPTSPSTFQGRFRVTCLFVEGNDAALGLVPTDTASNDQANQFVLLVRDSGLPGGTFDQEVLIPDVSAQDCAELVIFAGDGFLIESGNILVNDALP